MVRMCGGWEYRECVCACVCAVWLRGQGKEVISRISTNISSAGYLYTDSNGREFQVRCGAGWVPCRAGRSLRCAGALCSKRLV